MRAIDGTTGRVLARELSLAGTLFPRLKGLIGRKTLATGEGLWIRPCQGVHTFLMRFPIDVLFLDREGRVVKVVENLRPQRMTGVLFSSRSVLELPAGSLRASGTLAGHEVVIE